MSQEFHVMRPMLYYNGKFNRAIQKLPSLGDKLVIINGNQLSDDESSEIESSILNLVQKYSGKMFNFAGNNVFISRQFNYEKWNHVRSFMSYYDYPFRKFLIFGRHPYEKPLLPIQSPSVIQSIKYKKSSFPNMVFSNDSRGYFFPCTINVPIETRWGVIGSSIGLKNEINKLPSLMKSEGYWHSDIVEFIEIFKMLCDESIKSDHPIVIDG